MRSILAPEVDAEFFPFVLHVWVVILFLTFLGTSWTTSVWVQHNKSPIRLYTNKQMPILIKPLFPKIYCPNNTTFKFGICWEINNQNPTLLSTRVILMGIQPHICTIPVKTLKFQKSFRLLDSNEDKTLYQDLKSSQNTDGYESLKSWRTGQYGVFSSMDYKSANRTVFWFWKD